MSTIDIVALIEENTTTRLNHEYKSSILNKIKEDFSSMEQQLFVSSFYCYLKYDSNKEFVIDFDDVWKWCGFSRKDPAKRLLEKHLTHDVDYKVENFAPPIGGAKTGQVEDVEETAPPIGGAVLITQNGGQNKDRITLTVDCFKRFCIKSCHDYYIIDRVRSGFGFGQVRA